ncbi:LCP family protein [Planosporangium sp. 12N6]|uniref:LCP family glycopolymer transferase n=1 Tax=Planosporangium spinosum TaxID=3402278 RepID=UPI003CF60DA0
MRAQLYHVGCQPFAGWQALDYVRPRELIPDGGYGRQRHQQQLVAAVTKKIASAGPLGNSVATDRTLRARGSAVTFDGNGMSIADWIFTLKDVDPDIATVKTHSGRYNTQVINGQDFEILTDTSRHLFAAARDDTLDAFVAAHPDRVSAAAPCGRPGER